ncbi:SPOR domain-containing protein [Luteimonas sp. e5]
MERALKQRLIGAVVLVAIAVVFLPMLVKGPAPVSGAADVSLDVPNAPREGFQTRDLPLGAPAEAPAGGITGLDEPLPDAAAAQAGAREVPVSPGTAGGNWAVQFGHYASSADADRVVAALAGAGLGARAEAATLAGRSAWRVRIGPFATRAAAEDARLRAVEVNDKVPARVIALDADTTPATASATVSTRPLPDAAGPTSTATAPAPESKPTATQPAPAPREVAAAPKSEAKAEPKPAPVTEPTPKPAPESPRPAAADVGFAVQLGAFADPAAATALRDKARAAGLSAFSETINTADGPRTRVRLGPVADRAEAERLRAQAAARLGVNGMVRSHP